MDQKECIFNFTSKKCLGKKGKYVYFVAETYQPPNQNVSLLQRASSKVEEENKCALIVFKEKTSA